MEKMEKDISKERKIKSAHDLVLRKCAYMRAHDLYI